MGPKAASPDERLQFVLVCILLLANFAPLVKLIRQQCLHSIKDASGRLISPDWAAVAQVIGIKRNSAYVRYRDIVNREIQNGVPGLQPVGSRAAAAAAAQQQQPVAQTMALGAQPTPTSTPGATAAPTAISSPVKTSGRKRRLVTSDKEEDDDGGDEQEVGESSTRVAKKSRGRKSSGPSAKTLRSFESADVGAVESEQVSSFLDFDTAADLLAVEQTRFDIGRSSDADAEGEEDDEY
jgi:hypothetical protein